MNTKILLGLAGIIILVAVAGVVLRPKPKITVTEDESYILSDQLNALLDEELTNVSAKQTAFNEAAEDSIASDMSMFYYE